MSRPVRPIKASWGTVRSIEGAPQSSSSLDPAEVRAKYGSPERKRNEHPFITIPSGLSIADYFLTETDRRNPGCDGIDLWREGADYCYAWVESMIDYDLWVAYLLDIRTHVGEFDETRDFLFIFTGAGNRRAVEWDNQPIRFDAPTEQHRERGHRGLHKFVDWSEEQAERAWGTPVWVGDARGE